jgi:hypothetical protein
MSKDQTMKETGRTPSMFASLLVLGVMVALILLSVSFFGGEVAEGPLQVSMILATLFALSVAYYYGFRGSLINHTISKSFSGVMGTIIVILAIGTVIGTLYLTGTVANIIYYGVAIISARFYYITIFIIALALSMMLGSSLTPDGTAVAHGLVATTLRDFARFAMLFTPSWHHSADEQVVSPAVLKRIQTAGNSAAYKKSGTFHDHRQYFGEDPDHNSFQFDDVFADGAMFKHGNLGQGIYVDPGRDVVGVYFSTNGYIAPYGEDKMAGFIRRAAKMLAGD